MGERAKSASPELVQRHMKTFSRLPFGSLFFDRTAVVDMKLVERGNAELADELALLEEQMSQAAKDLDAKLKEPGGVGRLLSSDPSLEESFSQLLSRILPVLGDPGPEELLGRVPVAVELHLRPDQSKQFGLIKKGRLDQGQN